MTHGDHETALAGSTSGAGPVHHYATRDGVRLHYVEHGSGERALLVLPGITSPAGTWEFVARAFPPGYRVLVMDLRGRGESDRPASGYGLPDYAADVAAVVAAAGLERPAVLGHSLGARIAAATAATMPHLLGDLVLVDPPLAGQVMPLENYTDAIRMACQEPPDLDGLRRFSPTWTDQRIRERAHWLRTCAVHAIEETYRGFRREDFLDSWRALGGRVLLMYGTESSVATPAAVAEFAAANPAADVTAIPRAGHMVPWDNLDDFLAATLRFLGAAD